ncbi:P27 family phage terminase small subunit [Lacunimicrobium album]
MESINQNDPKQIELIKALFNQLEEYWDCVELIAKPADKGGGRLVSTGKGGVKAHPAIAIKNAALKDVKDIAKLLGIDAVKVEKAVDSKPRSVKELMKKKEEK